MCVFWFSHIVFILKFLYLFIREVVVVMFILWILLHIFIYIPLISLLSLRTSPYVLLKHVSFFYYTSRTVFWHCLTFRRRLFLVRSFSSLYISLTYFLLPFHRWKKLWEDMLSSCGKKQKSLTVNNLCLLYMYKIF